MIWALIGHGLNVVEQLLIAGIIKAMDPFIYVTVFYFFAFIFSSIYRHYTKNIRVEKYEDRITDHKGLVLGYVGGALLGNGFWFASLIFLGLGLTSFVLVFIRVLVTLYAYLYMDDRFPWDKAVSLCIGFGALAVFSASGGSMNPVGFALALTSCFGFALEFICRKKIVHESVSFECFLTLRQAVLMVCAASALCGILIFDLPGYGIFPREYNPFTIIILTAFIGGFVVHMVMAKAMRQIKLSQNEALSTIKPVVVALCGVVILGETITITQAICGIVIVLSALYFLRPEKPRSLDFVQDDR